MKKSTVSEPLVDLPSCLSASLPSYLNSSSSSAVTTKCEVIEKFDSMSMDIHEAASLPSYSDSSSSSGVTAKSDVTEKQDSMSVDMHDSESSDSDYDYLDDGDGDRSDYYDEEICVASCKGRSNNQKKVYGSGLPFYFMRRPKISPDIQKVLHEYLMEVEEREGFDIIDIPAPLINYPELHDDTYTRVDPEEEEEVMDMADVAIGDYNKKTHTEYKVVEIMKVNLELLGSYRVYYITFVAEMDGDDPVSKTFQAKVSVEFMYTDPKLEIHLCRIAKKQEHDSGI